MGTGIAIVGAKVAGLEVKCVDLNEDVLANSSKFVSKIFGIKGRQVA